MVFRSGWAFLLLLGIWLGRDALLSASGEAPSLSFSMTKLSLRGPVGKDRLAGSFHLLSGAQGVKQIKLLPSDLVAPDGKTIPASQYQLTPSTITSMERFDGVTINVSVNGVAASGTYSGTVEALFTGHDPKKKVEMTLEVVATAKTDLELKGDSSPGAIQATRRILWWGGTHTNPAFFSLRQKADAPGKIAQITVLGPATASADIRPIPPTAVSIDPAPKDETALALKPELWQTFTVQVDTANLAAGHYGGTIVATPEQGDDKTVTLDVKVRDGWLCPFLVLLVGVLLSWFIAWMSTTGTARLRALTDIDLLKPRLASGAGLPADFLNGPNGWRTKLIDLEKRAKTESPAAVQAEIDDLKKAVNKAQETSTAWQQLLDGWRSAFDRWSVQAHTDPDVAALLSSPLAAQTRAQLTEVDKEIAKGGFARGTVEGKMDALGRVMTTLAALIDAFPKVHASGDPQIQQQLPLTNTLQTATNLTAGGLYNLIELLKAKGLMTVPPPAVPHFAAPPAGALAPPGLGRRLVQWFSNPRNYLRLFTYLLGLLFLLLLLAAGMQALYVGKPTFGANPFTDYLGLLLWGIGADATRKQLTDLESAATYLRQRLGVP